MLIQLAKGKLIKPVNNFKVGDWIYGNIVVTSDEDNNKHYMISIFQNWSIAKASDIFGEVDPDTVCISTGLYSGNERTDNIYQSLLYSFVYTNDIVRCKLDNKIYTVLWNEEHCKFVLENEETGDFEDIDRDIDEYSLIVVGNTCDGKTAHDFANLE